MPAGGDLEPTFTLLPNGLTSNLSGAGLYHAGVLDSNRRVDVKKWAALCARAMETTAYKNINTVEEQRLRRQFRLWSEHRKLYRFSNETDEIDQGDADDPKPVRRKAPGHNIRMLSYDEVDNDLLWLPLASALGVFYWLNKWQMTRREISYSLSVYGNFGFDIADGLVLHGAPTTTTKWLFKRPMPINPAITFGAYLKTVCSNNGAGEIVSLDSERYIREQIVTLMARQPYMHPDYAQPDFDEFYRVMKLMREKNKLLLRADPSPIITRSQFRKWVEGA
jgi:hypothetical protein